MSYYVKHADGKYRISPTYEGPDWALTGDSDTCELYMIVYIRSGWTESGCRKRVRRIMKRMGIKGVIVEISYEGMWTFRKYSGMKACLYTRIQLVDVLPSSFDKLCSSALIVGIEGQALNGQNIFPSVSDPNGL